MMTTSKIAVRELEKGEALAFSALTFPSYQHLLALEPSVRHPGQGQQRQVQPVAIAASIDDEVVGLLIAEIPIAAGAGGPELLSIYVRPEARQKGVATALVGGAEDAIRRRGWNRVDAVYMTGKPSIPLVERIFARRGWVSPVTRAITVRFTPEEAAKTPWFDRVRLPHADFQMFPWTELGEDERKLIRSTHEADPWIDKGLEPWVHEAYGFDPISSLGLRYRGTVVGWVINHQIADDTVRFTCSFMRRDLSRRGRILPLYTESVRRLAKAGFRVGTLVTPLMYAEMAEFLRVRCASAVHFFGKTKGTAKDLTAKSGEGSK